MYFRIIGFKNNQIIATQVIEVPQGQESTLLNQHTEAFKQQYQGNIDILEVAAIMMDVKVV